MRASRTFLLFLSVLLLGGYIWFVERNRLSPAEQKAVDRQAFDLSMDRVDRIGIRTPELDVEMVSNGTQWKLTEPEGARASEPVVRQLLARFRSLSRGEFITPADMRSRELTLADFGLEIPQLLLTLGVGNERRVYSVGSPNPLGTALYVKEESSQNVMLVSSDLLEILPPDVSFFRDPELFPVGPSEVREVALVTTEGTVRLKREGQDWRLMEPVRAAADREEVESLLMKLQQSRIEGVLNRPGTDELEAFQGSGDLEVIRIWPSTETVPIEVTLGGTAPGNQDQALARITGQGGLVNVSKGLQVLARTPAAAFRDRNLLSLDAERIDSIRISEADRVIELLRTDGEWNMIRPLKLPASSARIQQVIAQWQEGIIERFLPLEGEADTEVGEVVFLSTEEDLTTRYTLLNPSPRPGRALVRKEGAAERFQVVPDVVKFLPRDPLAYLSREMVSIETDRVVRVSLETGDRSHVLVRAGPDAEWEMLETERQVQAEKVEALLSRFTRWFADSVVSFQPEIAGNPDFRFSLGLGGDSPVNLTFVVSGSMVWVQGREVMYTLTGTRVEELKAALLEAVSVTDSIDEDSKEGS